MDQIVHVELDKHFFGPEIIDNRWRCLPVQSLLNSFYHIVGMDPSVGTGRLPGLHYFMSSVGFTVTPRLI